MSYTFSENSPLAPRCSMRVGGTAKILVEPKNELELVSVIKDFRSKGEKYIVVGNCSNLIFTDEGFDGAVITTTAMRGISVDGTKIEVFCGETLSTLARTARDNSLTGLEFCYGIPGTVGGAVFMNAGAYGGDISQCFVSGRFINDNLDIITISCEEMGFGYRHSRMADENLILVSAVFETKIGNKDEIRAKMEELMQKRKNSQPLEYPSCGSAFKRPEGHFAGALIEQCGLKGKGIGGARVSEKHAGFIINGGNATATDVIALLDHVAKVVFENTGVQLEPEIRIIK